MVLAEKKISLLLIWLNLLASILLMLFPILTYSAPTYEENFIQSYGNTISEKEAKTLQAKLQNIVDQLVVARTKHSKTTPDVKTKIHILDNAEVSAMIFQDASKYDVHVSKGLIKLLCSSEEGQITESSVARGLDKIAAVLAHELSHPLIHLVGGKQRVLGENQYQELRFDAEAVGILRTAGFPTDAFIEASEQILKVEKRKENFSSWTAAAINSHPQEDVRLSSQRLMLTLDRYAHGSAQRPKQTPISKVLLDEINYITANSDDLSHTLDKLETYIKNLPQDKREGQWRISSDLIDRMDELIGKTDSKKLASLAPRIASVQLDLLQHYTYVVKNGYGETSCQPLDLNPSHVKALNTDPFYRSKEYLEAVKLQLPKLDDSALVLPDFVRTEKNREVFVERNFPAAKLKIAMGYLPKDIATGPFAHSIFKYSSSPEGLKMDSYNRFRIYEIENDLPPSARQSFMALVHDAFLRNHKDELEALSLLNKYAENETLIFPKLMDATPLAHIRATPISDSTQRYYQYIWDNRGKYGTYEFYDLPRIDWKTITESIGVKEEEGRRLLNEEIKKFASSTEYTEYLKDLLHNKAIHPFNQRTITKNGWHNDTLSPYLSGISRPEIINDPELAPIAKKLTAQYLVDQPDLLKRNYQSEVGNWLKDRSREMKPISSQEIYDKEKIFVDKYLDSDPYLFAGMNVSDAKMESAANPRFTDLSRIEIHDPRAVNANLLLENFKLVDSLSIPETEKRNLLRSMFQKATSELWDEKSLQAMDKRGYINKYLAVKRFFAGRPEEISRVLSILEKYDAIDWSQLFQNMQGGERQSTEMVYNKALPTGKIYKSDAETSFARRLAEKQQGEYFEWLESLKPFIQNNIRKMLQATNAPSEKAKQLIAFSEMAFPKLSIPESTISEAYNPAIQELKHFILDSAKELPLNDAQSFKLFAAISRHAPAPELDHELIQILKSSPPSERRTMSELILSENLLDSRKTRAELASEQIRISMHESTLNLDKILEDLNRYLPVPSLEKDRILEEIAWGGDIQLTAELKKIESAKSMVWKNVNPSIVNQASFLSEVFSELTLPEKMTFIRYFSAKTPENQFPAELTQMLARLKLKIPPPVALELKGAAARDQFRELVIQEFKREASKFASGASDTERIAVINHLMGTGQPSILSSSKDFDYVIHSLIGFKPDSTEEKLLHAFFDVVPKHEQAPSLAYLLVHSAEGKPNLLSLCELFQSVGIKTAQLGSVFDVFGPEASRELASAKDRAEPLSKDQIREILNEDLGAKKSSQIRLRKILGAASIKTAVEVEFADGRKSVLLVQRPFAHDQVAGNVKLMQQFVLALEKKGIKSQSSLATSLLSAMEGQLANELSTDYEAKQIQKASSVVKKVMPEKISKSGWKINVPQLTKGMPVTNRLLFVDYADGVSFNSLSSEIIKKQVGELNTEVSLKGLFSEGWFNPDLHTGNILIDEKNKTINLIDFGQAHNLKTSLLSGTDEVYQVEQLLRAVSEKNSEGIIRWATLLSKSGKNIDDPAQLLAKLDETLKNKTDVKLLVGILEDLAGHGVQLKDNITFGLIKGIVLLRGENYVSPEQFDQMLANEVRQSLTGKKAIHAAVDEWKSSPLTTCEKLFKFLGNHKSP